VVQFLSEHKRPKTQKKYEATMSSKNDEGLELPFDAILDVEDRTFFIIFDCGQNMYLLQDAGGIEIHVDYIICYEKGVIVRYMRVKCVNEGNLESAEQKLILMQKIMRGMSLFCGNI
jgi:hypothetical protein